MPRNGTTTPGFCIPGTTLLNHNACPAQLSPAVYSSAAQRSAAPCSAVRCPALRCCVVLRCAFFQSYSSTRHETKYQVPGAGMYVLCTRLFAFSSVDLSVPMLSPSRKLHPYCRSERDTSQHRAFSSAQAALGIIISLFAPNHGPLLSAPFTCTCF